MDTPEKHTPRLSVTRNLNDRFADKTSKSLLKMLTANVYLFVWHWSFYVQVGFKLPPRPPTPPYFSCVTISDKFDLLLNWVSVLVNLSF